MVLVVIGFLFASKFFACMLAWLLSQTWAMKTASKPKTTAKPVMTMVLARTFFVPLDATRNCSGLFVKTLEAKKYSIAKVASASAAMLKGF